MKYLLPITLSLFFISFVGVADDDRKVTVEKDVNNDKTLKITDTSAETSQEIKQSDLNAMNIFKSIANNKDLPTNLVEQTAQFIKFLLSKKAIDTELLYSHVLTLNSNISQLGEDEWVIKVRKKLTELRESSYSDEIHYNTNLSNQLRTRMPILAKASLLLNDTTIGAAQLKFLKDDFYEELFIFSNKYLKTSRFKAGLGISYAYLPTLKYSTQTNIDLTPFSPTIGNNSVNTLFNQDFASKSYLNFEIAAKMPWVEIGISIPSYSDDSTVISGVSETSILGSDDLNALYRSTIESKLEIEYDFSLRVPLLGSYKRLFYKYPNNKQMDYGLLFGLTGFKISDKITTDIRFRTDQTIFNDLQQQENIITEKDISFQTFYYGAYFEFEFVDELYMTLDVKWHNNQKQDDSRIDADGMTTSLRIIYTPTLDFIDW